MTEPVDHLEDGGERMRLTKREQSLLKQGAVITVRNICCDCGLEHLCIWERTENSDFAERIYRDVVATKKNRRTMRDELRTFARYILRLTRKKKA